MIYLDDILLLNQSKDNLQMDRNAMIWLLQSLWLMINTAKSTLQTTQKLKQTNSETNIVYFAGFGNEYISAVIDHFKDILEASEVDVSAAESEWTELKEILYSQ